MCTTNSNPSPSLFTSYNQKKKKKEEEEEEALKFLIWSACMNSQSLSTQENGQTLLSGPTNFGTNLSSKLKIRPKLINPNEYDSAALLSNFARLSSLSLSHH